jgi:hypothetical protein
MPLMVFAQGLAPSTRPISAARQDHGSARSQRRFQVPSASAAAAAAFAAATSDANRANAPQSDNPYDRYFIAHSNNALPGRGSVSEQVTTAETQLTSLSLQSASNMARLIQSQSPHIYAPPAPTFIDSLAHSNRHAAMLSSFFDGDISAQSVTKAHVPSHSAPSHMSPQGPLLTSGKHATHLYDQPNSQLSSPNSNPYVSPAAFSSFVRGAEPKFVSKSEANPSLNSRVSTQAPVSSYSNIHTLRLHRLVSEPTVQSSIPVTITTSATLRSSSSGRSKPTLSHSHGNLVSKINHDTSTQQHQSSGRRITTSFEQSDSRPQFTMSSSTSLPVTVLSNRSAPLAVSNILPPGARSASTAQPQLAVAVTSAQPLTKARILIPSVAAPAPVISSAPVPAPATAVTPLVMPVWLPESSKTIVDSDANTNAVVEELAAHEAKRADAARREQKRAQQRIAEKQKAEKAQLAELAAKAQDISATSTDAISLRKQQKFVPTSL